MAYVNINLTGDFTPYGQRGSDILDGACAGVCGCMAIHQEPLKAPDTAALCPAIWDTIAGWANKKATRKYSTDLNEVLALLKRNIPVISHISTHPHWVLIYGYEGLDTVVTASNFRCIDPFGTEDNVNSYRDIYLPYAQHYTGLEGYAYFE